MRLPTHARTQPVASVAQLPQGLAPRRQQRRRHRCLRPSPCPRHALACRPSCPPRPSPVGCPRRNVCAVRERRPLTRLPTAAAAAASSISCVGAAAWQASRCGTSRARRRRRTLAGWLRKRRRRRRDGERTRRLRVRWRRLLLIAGTVAKAKAPVVGAVWCAGWLLLRVERLVWLCASVCVSSRLDCASACWFCLSQRPCCLVCLSSMERSEAPCRRVRFCLAPLAHACAHALRLEA